MPEDLIIEGIDVVPEEFKESFEILSNKIKYLVKVNVLKLFAGGFSESFPLLVYAHYEHTNAYGVFKIGEKGIIQAESENWDTFIKNGHYKHWNVIHKKEDVQGDPHSLIVYTFAGHISGVPDTFHDLYARIDNPENILETLIEDILKPLSTDVQKGKQHLNVQEIFNTLPENLKGITERAQAIQGFENVTTKPKISINGREFYNPLFFPPFHNDVDVKVRNEVIPIPQGIVHGDMNARNLLFYRTGAFVMGEGDAKQVEVSIPCIIDYAHTGVKSLFTDIAKLESVLKFRLLDMGEKGGPIALEDLITFEQENVLCRIKPSDSPDITDPRLKKLFRCIEELRKYAANLIDTDPDFTPKGYWLELYGRTLIHIKYQPETISEMQKKYAFLSASIILTRHL